MKNTNITIKETTKHDLENTMSLWNSGEVMKFMGFPEGIGVTIVDMESWLEKVISKPERCHYSIYENEIGYCGESFYSVDDKGIAALDIKLLPKARGKGIGKYGLVHAIQNAFKEGNAKIVYVDPDRKNEKAWKLYEKIGFASKPRPDYLEDGDTYLEITRELWDNK